jgi:lipid-binding SYLF domain-containing protein
VRGHSESWKPCGVWSRFAAGTASLEGSKISVDDQNMRNLYGPNASLQSVLNGEVAPPAFAPAFLSTLNQVAKK